MKKLISYLSSINKIQAKGKEFVFLVPGISLIQLYKMAFDATINSSGSQKLTTFQYALASGYTELIAWPIGIFVLSVIGGIALWFNKPLFVLAVAIAFLIIGYLGAWGYGVYPLALIFIVCAGIRFLRAGNESIK